jgi:hypothetical protein
MFNWEDLNLPELETPEQTKIRLDQLYKQQLVDAGLKMTVDKGSPGFNPSVAQSREVQVMAALGLEPQEIALVLNIDEKILKRFYKRELSVSGKISNMVVARKALEMAASGRFPDMTKFWLKSRAKWKETSGLEITGKDGGPVEINSARDKLARAMNVNPDMVQPTGDE